MGRGCGYIRKGEGWGQAEGLAGFIRGNSPKANLWDMLSDEVAQRVRDNTGAGVEILK